MLYLGSFFLGWYKNYSDYWVWGVYSVSNIIQHAPWTRKISETISLFCLPFVNYFRLPPMPSVRRARQCTLFPGVKKCSESMRTNFSGERLMWPLMIFRFSTQLTRFKRDHQVFPLINHFQWSTMPSIQLARQWNYFLSPHSIISFCSVHLSKGCVDGAQNTPSINPISWFNDYNSV